MNKEKILETIDKSLEGCLIRAEKAIDKKQKNYELGIANGLRFARILIVKDGKIEDE